MRFLPLVAVVVAMGVTVALVFAPSRGTRATASKTPYAVSREPFPTIQVNTITPGLVVAVRFPGDDTIYPVAVRSTERVGDRVVLEHFDPRGCPIGVHGGECITRTALPPDRFIRFFPTETA